MFLPRRKEPFRRGNFFAKRHGILHREGHPFLCTPYKTKKFLKILSQNAPLKRYINIEAEIREHPSRLPWLFGSSKTPGPPQRLSCGGPGVFASSKLFSSPVKEIPALRG
jgi:hypothetical protein